MKALYFLIIIFLSQALKAQQVNESNMSIEWLTHSSEVIAYAKPKESFYKKGKGDLWFQTIIFSTTEVLKGEKNEKELSVILDHHGSTPVTDNYDTSKFYLVFATTKHNYQYHQEFKNKYMLAGNLNSMYVQKSDMKGLYSSSFENPKHVNTIRYYIAKQIHREKLFKKNIKDGVIEAQRVQIPPNSELFLSLWEGSSKPAYLIVPNYKITSFIEKHTITEKQLKTKIKKLVKKNKKGARYYNGSTFNTYHFNIFDHISQYLQQYAFTEQVCWDKCIVKPAIYPGNSNIQITFKSKKGLQTKIASIQEGTTRDFRVLGWRPFTFIKNRDILKFKGLSTPDNQEKIERIYNCCTQQQTS